MKTATMFLAGLTALLFGMPTHAAIEARCDQMHAVMYAGGLAQPLMRIKVKNTGATEALNSLKFSMKGTTRLSDVTSLSIYCSGSVPYFSPKSGSAYKANLTGPTKVSSTMEFKGSQALALGDTYLWLVCDVGDRARGKNTVDAECTDVKISGNNLLVPANASPNGVPQVYHYQSRIIPYYRDSFLMQWIPNLLTPAHFPLMSDLIYFSVGVDTNGSVTGTTNAMFLAGVAKLKNLRGKNDVNLILGVTPNAGTMSSVTADATKRRKFAKGLVVFALEQGFMGIDVDWEYPNSDADWRNYELFLNDVREELAVVNCPGGFSLSIALSMNYKTATPAIVDQLDFLNNMSYDNGGQHSTMDRMVSDVTRSRTAGLPDYKIICGLPFYSCETRSARDWDQQQGYDTIVGWFPNIAPGTNTFTSPVTKEPHYFNGVNLIKQKAKYVKDNKLGGMMIWAYDRDVPLSNGRSLTRAISQTVKPLKR